MQKVLCTTLLAAGVASGDLVEISVDGVADTSYGDFAGSLFFDTDDNSLTGQIFLPAVLTPTGAYPGTVTFDGLYTGGEATSGETSQGSVTGPQFVGGANMSFPFLGGFDLDFDVVFGDSGLGVTYLHGDSPFGPLEATLSFNYTVPSGAAIPAPGAIALLGLAGLGRRRRN